MSRSRPQRPVSPVSAATSAISAVSPLSRRRDLKTLSPLAPPRGEGPGVRGFRLGVRHLPFLVPASELARLSSTYTRLALAALHIQKCEIGDSPASGENHPARSLASGRHR